MTAPARLGFGCASLGSRVDRADGLRALAAAVDAGIDWFDVAPSYGDGAAEGILGDFLRSSGAAVRVCTKVGIEPPQIGFAARTVRPLARAVLAHAPALRGAFRRHRPAPARAPLTAQKIRSSVDRSLHRLSRDTIDVLALHEPSAGDVARDEVLRSLDDVRAAGKVRHVAIAGQPAEVLAGFAASSVYDVAQIAHNPVDRGLGGIAAAAPAQTVIHSVFGASELVRGCAALLRSDKGFAEAASQAGYSGTPERIAACFLLDFGLAANRDGIVLLSMFAPRHLSLAVERRDGVAPLPAQLRGLADRLSAGLAGVGGADGH